MSFLQAGESAIGGSDAQHSAAHVRTGIAEFRELASLGRGEDTGLVLDTMKDYNARNGERDLAAVDLAVRGVAR